MPSSTISKSKKYSRKRNNRKRRHSRRMQRKSRSRNAYNRRRRTMFGGAPNGVYKVTAVKKNDSNGADDVVSQQNSNNESALDTLKSMGYTFHEISPPTSMSEVYSTAKFNNDFANIDDTKEVNIHDQKYRITVTSNGDNYNVKLASDSGLGGDVTFAKVIDESEKNRIEGLPEYNSQ